MKLRSLRSLVATTGIASGSLVLACSGSNENASTLATESLTDRAAISSPAEFVNASTFRGSPSPGEQMRLSFHLALRNADAAEAEARAVNNPADPTYGNFLTTSQFRAKYAPTDDSVEQVRAWAESFGLKTTYTADNNLMFAAEGTVAQVEAAFDTRIGRYEHDGAIRRSPMVAPSMPSGVRRLLVAVRGLTDGRPMRSARVKADGSHGSARLAAVSGTAALQSADNPPGVYAAPPPPGVKDPPTCSATFGATLDTSDPGYGTKASHSPYQQCGFTPPSLRTAIGIDRFVSSGHDGRGVTVAIVDAYAAAATLLADVQDYARRNDPTHPLDNSQFKAVVAPGPNPSSPPSVEEIQGWYGEQTLDVEAVHSIAPGASILFVGVKDNVDAASPDPYAVALNYIIDGDLATIISNSWLDYEHAAVPVDFASYNPVITQANLKGIGLYFASGDDGDAIDVSGVPDVAFPASHPGVTAVGGTSLATRRNGTALWETGWETGGASLQSGAWSPVAPGDFYFGSGGGRSSLFAQPTYQNPVVPSALATVEGKLQRVLPDLSLLGDPQTGLRVGETQTFSDGVYYDDSGVWGGTSLATPLTAALVALAEQHRGKRIGFINPTLYAHRWLTTDIAPRATTGTIGEFYDNSESGSTTPSAGTYDYPNLTIHSGVGYDDVTGLGVPNAALFVNGI